MSIRVKGNVVVFQSLYRCVALSSLVLSILFLAPPAARADDTVTPPKIDTSWFIRQPVYPQAAKDKNEQGNTILEVYVETSGKPSKVNVETTSGFDDLDQTAVASANHWRFVPASNGHDDVAGWVKLTVHFQLTPLPRPAITETEVYALADIGDLIVCRALAPPSGSNISPDPVCRTKREWDDLADRSKHNDATVPRSRAQGSSY